MINPLPDTARLEHELLGTLVRPQDPDWDEARAAWNLAVDQQPAAVLFAVDAGDVAAVVRYAAAADLRVTAQSTGHLASALGDLARTVLVRTTRMQSIEIDVEGRTARVGAGVTWGAVNAALEGTGLVGLAGSSADVGVVGYTLGGGYGWLARSRGLASSSLVSVELVLADGGLVVASEDENPELFWAVRGGGGEFGIVTAIEFRLHPVANVVAGMLLFPVERVREVLLAYERWTSDLEECVTSCARLLRFPPMPELPDGLRGRAFVGVDGAIDADDARAERLLAPLRELGPKVDTFARIPATELTSIHLDPPAPTPALGDGFDLDEFPPEAVDALLGSAAGDPDSPLLLVDIRHLEGAVGRGGCGGAVDSLPGRYVLYAGGVVADPQSRARIEHALDSLREALDPWVSVRHYGNFRETVVPAETIWDEPTLARLRLVKETVDPRGRIRGAHPLTGFCR